MKSKPILYWFIFLLTVFCYLVLYGACESNVSSMANTLVAKNKMVESKYIGDIPLCPSCKESESSTHQFGKFLKKLALHPSSYPVHLYTGAVKGNQSSAYQVLKLDIGDKNLLQCADAVMRIRAEYLKSENLESNIKFLLANNQWAEWNKWGNGERPKLQTNDKFSWSVSAQPDESATTFTKYLEFVYNYANTVSLKTSLKPRKNSIEPGDVFVQGGYPGHAVIVLRVAKDDQNRDVVMLAQSYMPAQEIHVLKNGTTNSPWFIFDPSASSFNTPDWTFKPQDLYTW